MPQFSIIIFGYDVTSYFTFLIGVIITALTNYFLLSQREKKQLKMKIQIETAEALQEMIKKLIDVSPRIKLLGLLMLDLTSYNVNFKSKDAGFGDINKTLMDRSSKRVQECFIEWDRNFYSLYSNAFFSIQFYIEMHQIVLIRFQNFHSELGNCFKQLQEKKNQADIYKNTIVTLLMQNKYIEDEIINKFQKEVNDFRDIAFDIDSYLLDMQIGLQNEFYRKLFKIKIPTRKPKDPNVKVIRPKKSKAFFIG